MLLCKRKVSEEVAEAVRKQNLSGIEFTEESKRYYPKETWPAISWVLPV